MACKLGSLVSFNPCLVALEKLERGKQLRVFSGVNESKPTFVYVLSSLCLNCCGIYELYYLFVVGTI